MIVAEFDAKQVDGFLSRLAAEPLKKAQMHAVNRAADRGRTFARRRICAKWNLPPTIVNKRLDLRTKATGATGMALLTCESRPVSLTYFGAIWYKGSRRTGRKKSTSGHKNREGRSGVYVRVRKDSSKITHFPSAFIAYGRRGSGLGGGGGVAELGTSGHIGVFDRRLPGGEKSWHLPIQSRKTMSIPSMFKQKDVYEPTIEFIGKVYQKEFYRLLWL